MAAGLGFKTFNTGDVLSAADTNGYLMQGVLVFADAAEYESFGRRRWRCQRTGNRGDGGGIAEKWPIGLVFSGGRSLTGRIACQINLGIECASGGGYAGGIASQGNPCRQVAGGGRLSGGVAI